MIVLFFELCFGLGFVSMSNQTNKLHLYNTVHNTHLTVCHKHQGSVNEKQQEEEDLRKIDIKLKILIHNFS